MGIENKDKYRDYLALKQILWEKVDISL